MVNILTMWKLEKVFLVLAVCLCSGEANAARNDASNFKDVSKKCYYCLGEEKGVDNIAACSTDNNLDVEECPFQDLFDKCVVVQAFSLSKNTTIFKRECTSRRLCEERRVCSDPDFSDCRYECCTGDLCNHFGFTDDVRSNMPQPTVALTTRKYKELVQSGSRETVVTGNVKQTTVVPEVTTQGSATGERQSLSTSSNANEEKRQEIEPVVEEGCEDLDSFCPTYVTDPSHWPVFCKDNDKYTSIACRKTCKFCISGHEVKATTETMSTGNPNLEDCEDQRSDCQDLKVLDYCRLMTEYMKGACGKTCGFCSVESYSRKTIVTEKVMTSESVVTETTMKPSTAKPVNTDLPGSVVTETTMKPSTAKPINTDLPTTSTTEQTTSERTETTSPTTSGQVQSGVKFQPTLENKDCQDKRDNCDSMKAMDYCRLMTWFMENNCRRTCGLCSNGVAGGPTSKVVRTSQPTPSEEMITTVTKLPTTPETTSKRTERITTNSTITELPTTEKTATNVQKRTENITTSPTTSGEVQSGVTFRPTSENEDCQDKRDNCENLKAMDYCRLMTWFMENNCRRTCGLCAKGKPNTPESNTTEKSISHSTPSQVTSEKLTEPSPEPTTVMTSSNTSPTTTHTTTPTTTLTTSQLTTLEPTSEPKMSTSKTTVKPQPTSNLTINVTKDCYDKRKKCVRFAKYPGYCDYNREFMIKHCRKSCGFCTDGGTSGSISTSEPSPEITSKSPAGPGGITSDLLPEVTTKPPVVTSELTPEVTSHKTTPETTPEITSPITTPVTPNITSRPAPVVTTEPSAEPTSKTSPSNKEGEKYDVVFVIGAREPNASESFDQQKKIIQEILKKSTLTDARYGLVIYTNEGQVNLIMDSAVPKSILNELLNVLPWRRDGSRVDKGIKKALELFGSRPEAKQRIVAFINSPSDASYKESKEARQEAEGKGVKLIVVGMGRGYDTGEFLNMAPNYGDRVFFDGTGSSDVTSELEQAAVDTIEAIMQVKEDKTDLQGIPVVEVIDIAGPKNSTTAKFGDKLRWKIWPWSKCVDGKQSRVVRCYHFFAEKDYHVIINACIKHVAPMPEKERDC